MTRVHTGRVSAFCFRAGCVPWCSVVGWDNRARPGIHCAFSLMSARVVTIPILQGRPGTNSCLCRSSTSTEVQDFERAILQQMPIVAWTDMQDQPAACLAPLALFSTYVCIILFRTGVLVMFAAVAGPNARTSSFRAREREVERMARNGQCRNDGDMRPSCRGRNASQVARSIEWNQCNLARRSGRMGERTYVAGESRVDLSKRKRGQEKVAVSSQISRGHRVTDAVSGGSCTVPSNPPSSQTPPYQTRPRVHT